MGLIGCTTSVWTALKRLMAKGGRRGRRVGTSVAVVRANSPAASRFTNRGVRSHEANPGCGPQC
jgi:hypothetical protein